MENFRCGNIGSPITQARSVLHFGAEKPEKTPACLTALVLASRKNPAARNILKHLDLTALMRAESPEEVKNRLREKFIAENPIRQAIQPVNRTDLLKAIPAEALKTLAEFLPENLPSSNLWSRCMSLIKKWRHR
jgi:hypothetical protein